VARRRPEGGGLRHGEGAGPQGRGRGAGAQHRGVRRRADGGEEPPGGGGVRGEPQREQQPHLPDDGAAEPHVRRRGLPAGDGRRVGGHAGAVPAGGRRAGAPLRLLQGRREGARGGRHRARPARRRRALLRRQPPGRGAAQLARRRRGAYRRQPRQARRALRQGVVKLSRSMADTTVFARMNGDQNDSCMQFLKDMDVVEAGAHLPLHQGRQDRRPVHRVRKGGARRRDTQIERRQGHLLIDDHLTAGTFVD
jgi:hypothetical protein